MNDNNVWNLTKITRLNVYRLKSFRLFRLNGLDKRWKVMQILRLNLEEKKVNKKSQEQVNKNIFENFKR